MNIVIPEAITVLQPHAWAIVHGPKRYENRVWYTARRGPLLIHAGVSRERIEDEAQYPGEPDEADLVFGAIVGIVHQINCVRPHQVRGQRPPCVEGPWCHEYADRWAFVEPIPCRGNQGFWRPPAELHERIGAEIGRAVPVGVRA